MALIIEDSRLSLYNVALDSARATGLDARAESGVQLGFRVRRESLVSERSRGQRCNYPKFNISQNTCYCASQKHWRECRFLLAVGMTD